MWQLAGWNWWMSLRSLGHRDSVSLWYDPRRSSPGKRAKKTSINPLGHFEWGHHLVQGLLLYGEAHDINSLSLTVSYKGRIREMHGIVREVAHFAGHIWHMGLYEAIWCKLNTQSSCGESVNIAWTHGHDRPQHCMSTNYHPHHHGILAFRLEMCDFILTCNDGMCQNVL